VRRIKIAMAASRRTARILISPIRGRHSRSADKKALSINPELAFAHGHLAAAYALEGDTDRARAERVEARRLSGDGRFASLARLRAARSWGVPKIRALYETTYFVGLRKAGLPEK
jgi:hypothetical protein